jgi:hypothetical protein
MISNPDEPNADAYLQAIRNTHVNIVDLIEWGRCGDSHNTVRVFNTKQELQEYTMETEKYFPQSSVHNNGETNVVLRHLLRRFFKAPNVLRSAIN